MNNYKNADCIHKGCCIRLVRDLIRDFLGPDMYLRTLSLPAMSFKLENWIRKEYKDRNLQMFYEKDKDTYHKQALYLIKERWYTGHHRGNVFNVINIPKVTFNVVWLDLCGTLTNKVYKGVHDFIKSGKLEKSGSLFIITLQHCKRQPHLKRFYSKISKEWLDEYIRSYDNFYEVKLAEIFRTMLSWNGYSASIEANESYSPTSGGAKMGFYAFYSY